MTPTPFGRYLLLDKVASGGMAEVWRAKLVGQGGFERIIAIKKILPHVAEDADFITMFTDEAKITVQLQHSNIGQVYEFDKLDDIFYIAMEYISGKDLKSVWSNSRARKQLIPLELSCLVVQRMAEGLDYAHQRKDNFGKPLGIVHRDVSPQNCLISWDGEVKVIDFGIAKAADKAGHTRAGTLKGKFAYMAPEQIRGLPLDGRADVFALGVVLYELVTGRRGFQAEGGSEFSLLEKVRKVEIKPPTMVNRDLPQEIERIIFKALAKDRENRYQTGADLAEDLQRFLLSRGKPPNRNDLGRYLRENFTVDYDKERLRLESYKDVEWSGPTPTARTAPAAPIAPQPVPASLAAVQAALAEEHALGEPSAFESGASSPTRTSIPGHLAGASTSYVMAGQVYDENTAHTPTRPPMAVGATRTDVVVAPPRPRGGLLAALIVVPLVLLAAIGAGAYVFLKPKPGTIALTVAGPPSATVELDGAVVGTASPTLAIKADAGPHVLVIREPGYAPESRPVVLEAGKLVVINPTLQIQPAAVSVVSVPGGAPIFIDDKPTGQVTPAKVEVEPDVPHRVSLVHERFHRVDETVTVKAGEQAALELTLKPSAILLEVITEPPGAKVKMNGVDKGESPVKVTVPLDGSYPSFTFSRAGCKTLDSSWAWDDETPEQKKSFPLECR